VQSYAATASAQVTPLMKSVEREHGRPGSIASIASTVGVSATLVDRR
jgi:hypothetical protein